MGGGGAMIYLVTSGWIKETVDRPGGEGGGSLIFSILSLKRGDPYRS
jgi:hypothetical protein